MLVQGEELRREFDGMDGDDLAVAAAGVPQGERPAIRRPQGPHHGLTIDASAGQETVLAVVRQGQHPPTMALVALGGIHGIVVANKNVVVHPRGDDEPLL